MDEWHYAGNQEGEMGLVRPLFLINVSSFNSEWVYEVIVGIPGVQPISGGNTQERRNERRPYILVPGAEL